MHKAGSFPMPRDWGRPRRQASIRETCPLPGVARRSPLTRRPTAAPACVPASAFTRWGGLGNLYFRVRPLLASPRLPSGVRTAASAGSAVGAYREHGLQPALPRRGWLGSPTFHPGPSSQRPWRRGARGPKPPS